MALGVVDVQFLKDARDEYSPKEIAIASVAGEYFAHWVIAPENDLTTLSEEARKKNAWLATHHHGIDYFEGESRLEQVSMTLRNLCKKFEKIYVRGNQKRDFLRKIVARDIVNLEEDASCPTLDSLPINDTRCLLHGYLLKDGKNFKCALNNACRIKDWLRVRDMYICL